MTQGPGVATSKAGLVLLKSTWFFQAWFRDKSGPGGTGSNFTHGVAVTFAP